MIAWSAFHALCLPHLVECSVPLFEQELVTAANTFFKRTRVWREWLDDIVTVPNVLEYDIDPPIGASMVRIEAAKRAGHLVDVAGAFELAMQEGDSGDAVTSPDRTTLLLTRSPAADRLSIFASLAPSRAALGIPDAQFNEHYDAITNAAIARVCAIPGYAFSNPSLASARSSLVEAEIGRIAALAHRSLSNTMPKRRVHWI
jgi:hypothetical protein